MELFHVNKQWSTRPADETFNSLQDALVASKKYAATAHEKTDVPTNSLRVEPTDKGDLALIGRGNVPAVLTHWSFGQVASMVGAPAGWLRKTPATLAAQNVNWALKNRFADDNDAKINMLIHANGSMLVRAFNSEKYSRIWNWELLERLVSLQSSGWHNPRPFNTEAEVGTVWVSDHDMFVFQVNDSNLISVPGPDGKPRFLRRGFIMSNSEVGAGKWTTMTFLFDFMCCNRIIWGCENVTQIDVRHIGNANQRLAAVIAQFRIDIQRYAESSGDFEQARIARAASTVIGSTKEQVITAVFKALGGDVSRKTIDASYDTAKLQPDTAAGPNTAWGLANGMTRYSQTIPYADERLTVDRAAGKLVEMAF